MSEACNDTQEFYHQRIKLTAVGLVIGEAVAGASVGVPNGRYVGAW